MSFEVGGGGLTKVVVVFVLCLLTKCPIVLWETSPYTVYLYEHLKEIYPILEV